VNEDARWIALNCLAIHKAQRLLPTFCRVSCMLEMNAPAIVFRAAGAKDIAISQSGHGFF